VFVALDGERGVDRPGRAGPGHLERSARAWRLGPGPAPLLILDEWLDHADGAVCQGQLEESPSRHAVPRPAPVLVVAVIATASFRLPAGPRYSPVDHGERVDLDHELGERQP